MHVCLINMPKDTHTCITYIQTYMHYTHYMHTHKHKYKQAYNHTNIYTLVSTGIWTYDGCLESLEVASVTSQCCSVWVFEQYLEGLDSVWVSRSF